MLNTHTHTQTHAHLPNHADWGRMSARSAENRRVPGDAAAAADARRPTACPINWNVQLVSSKNSMNSQLATHLELVNGMQRIDAWYSAVLQRQYGRSEVIGSITWRLPYQYEIRAKRTMHLFFDVIMFQQIKTKIFAIL